MVLDDFDGGSIIKDDYDLLSCYTNGSNYEFGQILST